mmetsp:Transcript_14977/g.23188  ORF Transcript_14977/g.23188 Transcript_14977/m.23188 type:complete len:312 (-) Transcript_14977:334-1269(-)
MSLLCFHLVKDVVGHLVHEVLRSHLALLHFVLPVLLLLIKHLSVFFLGLQIVEPLLLFLILLAFLVQFIFLEHLLKVFALLLSLLLLEVALSVHLVSKAVQILHLLVQLLFLLVALSASFIEELLVSAPLVVEDFTLHVHLLLLLSLLKEFSVLLGEVIVGTVLVLFVLLAVVLRFDLALELLTDETLTLGIAHKGLLLLLVVKKNVELLNGSPLVILINFGEDFGVGLLGMLRQSIKVLDLAGEARHLRRTAAVGFSVEGALFLSILVLVKVIEGSRGETGYRSRPSATTRNSGSVIRVRSLASAVAQDL